ncbi:hypothetical protein R3P38DRAFT_2573971, partial [Favolaschia claudopus]
IKQIAHLARRLPEYVPEASPEDNKIHHTLTKLAGIDNSVWGSFNRKFDILFGEDVRVNGRLKYVRRGEQGMTLVADYLSGLDWKSSHYIVDLALPKLERIVAEMQYLWYEYQTLHIRLLIVLMHCSSAPSSSAQQQLSGGKSLPSEIEFPITVDDDEDVTTSRASSPPRTASEPDDGFMPPPDDSDDESDKMSTSILVPFSHTFTSE